ncbi:MAG: NAD(P)-dependent oxidoreductase [Streptosporangiaceae bacterium]
MKPWTLAALLPLDASLIRSLFEPLDVEVVLPPTRDRAGQLAALAEADLVVGDFTGELAMDREAVRGAPRLAFLQMPMVGVDSCDLDALTAAGVPVANAAGSNARAVAEWSVGSAFALCRQLAWADRRLRAGLWPQLELLARNPRELHTQRIGIAGFGTIGAETARLFEALGCQVSYWSRTPRPEASATYRELDDLVATSDILVLALPAAPATLGLFGAERLALLPAGAILINASRGGVAPDSAVVAALESGRLSGAALDVFDVEPLAADSPLRSLEQVLLSPHGAGATGQAQFNIVGQVVANITAALRGEPVAHVVNGVEARIRKR